MAIRLQVLLLFLSATVSAAAPSITGFNASLGVISGSDFGTHADYGSTYSDYLIVGWNDFESGSVTNSAFKITSNNDNFSVVAGGRANSSYYMRKRAITSRLGSLSVYNQTEQDQWYWAFYLKVLNDSNSDGKFTRLWSDENTVSSPESTNIYLSTGNTDTYVRGNTEYGAGGSAQYTSPDTIGYDTWRFIEVLVDVPNQTADVWMDGKHQWQRTDWIVSDFNGLGDSWGVGHMIEIDTESGFDFDDLYFSHTTSRVAISDASTWTTASIHHIELQPPLSWSATSITVDFNQGAFSEGDTVYLYVVDSDGAVNASGYQITIPRQQVSLGTGQPATIGAGTQVNIQ